MKQFVIFCLAGCLFAACSSEQVQEQPVVKKKPVDEAKPMALMMRAIYEQSRDMKTRLEAGEALDASFYRFMEFHKLEPTDSTVLVSVFYEHNENFKQAFEDLLRSSNRESYNAMLTQCVNCHSDFCPGPIKRINKLRFDEL
jgi:hypothetical protein